MITLQLTNDHETVVLPILSPPLTEAVVEGAQDIQTLDNNISTYFTTNKRQWSHSWDYLSEDDFNTVKSFYDYQWVDFKYPLLTISYYGISNVPVRMYLDPKKIIDNCGTVEDVSVSFRETRQL